MFVCKLGGCGSESCYSHQEMYIKHCTCQCQAEIRGLLKQLFECFQIKHVSEKVRLQK